MAARTVYKLLKRTCSTNIKPPLYPPYKPFVPSKRCVKERRTTSETRGKRSLSQNKKFDQLKTASRSFESLHDYYNEDDSTEVYHERPGFFQKFPPKVAQQEENQEELEDATEDANVYILGEDTRNEDNFEDINNYMRKMDEQKTMFLFEHLQPCRIQPFGSSENMHMPFRSRKFQIVYPTINTSETGVPQQQRKRKQLSYPQYQEFSSYIPAKENFTSEQFNQVATVDLKPREEMNRRFSTTKQKSTIALEKSKISVPTRKSSRAFVKEPKRNNKILLQTLRNMTASKEHPKEQPKQSSTKHSLSNKPESECSDYVTVSLGQLQEECRKAKKCKPKKISFGRLPKHEPKDCPCEEKSILKEGKPLLRLKKRFDVKPPPRVCPLPCTDPRADDNYKIVPKTLRPIEVKTCPCEEREMTDLIIKRLPKKKVQEPKRVVCCEPEQCCGAVRADGKLTVKKKKLPSLEINKCPCVENPPLKDFALKKLKRKEVKEPLRVCPKALCEEPPERADDNLKVVPKTLPIFEPKCGCVEAPKMEEGPPLHRLPKFKYVEKPREPCVVECGGPPRADKDLKVEKKKLPVLHPQICPCIEEPIPQGEVKLKRLQAKPVNDKRIDRDCPVPCGGPRADDGLTLKPKKLPVLQPGDCPCVEMHPLTDLPLKRLIPTPVPERPRICPPPPCESVTRADDKLVVKKKSLPIFTPLDCPCIEPPPPLDVKPLVKLKAKPVVERKKICPINLCNIDPERADKDLKVEAKQLPKLEINVCPCIEAPPLKDIPLLRLKKARVPEPIKNCPEPHPCEENPRSDEDDWMYWKRVEVKPPECETPTGTRNFSTYSKRSYTTSVRKDLGVSASKYQLASIYQDLSRNRNVKYVKSSTSVDSLRKTSGTSGLNLSKSVSTDRLDAGGLPIKISSLLDGNAISNVSRNFSTYDDLYSDSLKERMKSPQTPQCECPLNNKYLQPQNPILPEPREEFIKTWPTDEEIDESRKKSRLYMRPEPEDDSKVGQKVMRPIPDSDKCIVCEPLTCPPGRTEKEPLKEQIIASLDSCGKVKETIKQGECMKEEKKLSLLERIVTYFKARDCPSPEEFRRMRLREDAEIAAQKAGLCLYDPKELLKQKELPKVITADCCKEGIGK